MKRKFEDSELQASRSLLHAARKLYPNVPVAPVAWVRWIAQLLRTLPKERVQQRVIGQLAKYTTRRDLAKKSEERREAALRVRESLMRRKNEDEAG